MCGINGLVNFDSGQKANLNLMNQAIHHRGPDAEGIFLSDKINLGHVRLSIIDLTNAANQPMESKDFVLVFNGEIYNYKLLKEELGLECSTSSDTEVVLKGFEKLGVQIFNRLNGMFALAILNKKTNQLFLARDRMGIKPLYLYQHHNKLAFSSEIKGITALSEIKSNLSINPDAVTDFFHLGYIPSPRSIYKEISKFPSGSYAEINNDKITYHKYWSVSQKITPSVLKDEQQGIAELDRLLNDAVKTRLQSDVPFGTFLSGGVDSSLITAIAQKNSTKPLNTFSIGFSEKSHNESHYAAMVAKHLGTKHHEFNVSHEEAKGLIEDIVLDYDEPYADSSCIPTMLVSKLARNLVKMTLSGDGGDELFMGYGFYNWAKRLNNPFIENFRKPIGSILKLGGNRFKRAATMFDYEKKMKKSHVFSQEQYYFSSKEVKTLLKNKGNLLTDLNQPISSSRKLSSTEEQSFFDIQYYLKDELLNKVDIATMKFGLEDRVPLLDHHIVEFALNLSSSLKIKDGEQKYLLKQVLYKYVPKEIFNRPKQGFSVPLGKWLKTDLRFLIDEYLSNEVLEKVGWIDKNYARQLIQRYLKGEDYLYVKIWAMIIFQQWYIKVYLNGRNSN